MQDLITTLDIVPAEVFVENGLDPMLKDIRGRIDAFEPDITTVKGRKEIKSFAHAVARSKTLLDDLGKDLTAEMDATIKVVQVERKRMRDTLSDWKTEARQPLTDWEEEEKAREKFLDQRMTALSAMDDIATGSTVEEIDARLQTVADMDIDDTWSDREGLAQTTREKILESLQERRADRFQFEEQQAELEAQRIENEKIKAENERLEREKQEAEEEARETERIKREHARAEEDRIEAKRQREEREEQMKQEAADRATAEAEVKAMEERERLEREKQEALDRETRAKEAAEQAAENERNRIAAEQLAEQEAARKREANKRHRGKINTAAKKAFMTAGLSEDDAKLAVTTIAAGNVPNVKISY